MPSVRINMRIDEDLWAFVIQEAKARDVSKTTIVESGIRRLREAPGAGLTTTLSVGGREVARTAPSGASTFHDDAMARQQKLNDAKYGRRS